ncbi:hypothetical protein [Aestuariicoccus sp. MJ-SS9]|uniref:hypothetical protein n=1 Tax=Aestuariicoccus sp. MJ-SS9 TaxID=3079855 RepID=UPI002912A95E|nr:hypothetical protein [Aestuariicoccus sp. MJ-SS9]MDU8909941.1 hypothetical protein [Aestuariicoccus sp. MJ-SS9]
MSSLDDRSLAAEETRALDARYAAARAEIERSRAVEQGQAGALVFAALAYGDALDSNTAFAKASHAAKLFCIAAVFVIPNLLVIRVLL